MLDIDNSVIICIDIQEKLVNMLQNGESVKNNAVKLLKAADILGINTIITEQYPKGLGATVNEIKNIKDFKTVEKTSFSALRTKEFEREFDKIEQENVILFGIETHICVYQTALDHLDEGFNVYIIADCSSSRSKFNHDTALEMLKNQGVNVVSLEMVLFEFLKTSHHPNFKEIQSLIK